MSARDQLERLRQAMEKGMSAEDRADLSQINLRIKQLEDYHELAKRPGIIELLAWCRRHIIEINEQLSTDVDLLRDGHEGERLAMINRKEILLYFTDLFDAQADLESLEKELADRAEIFEDYQRNR